MAPSMSEVGSWCVAHARLVCTFVAVVCLAALSAKSMAVYQRAEYRSSPDSFNRFCSDKGNDGLCEKPHEFKHFVWMLVDGMSISHSRRLRSVFELDSSPHAQSYRVLNAGEPMSNAIYTSFMTGVMATNVQGDAIEGDTIFKQMNHHGMNVHYSGPEWPMMQLYPSSDGVFSTTEYIDNEEIVFPQMFGYDLEEEQEKKWGSAKKMLDKYKDEDRSLFMVTTTVDTLSHHIGDDLDKSPLTEMGDRWGENMRGVKEWLDENPDTLFIYMADHGEQVGSKLHGDVRDGNEPMFFMYSPKLQQYGQRLKWVDTVDVCSTITQVLPKKIDIPGDSIGFAHSVTRDPKMTFTLAYRNAVELREVARRTGGLHIPKFPMRWREAQALVRVDAITEDYKFKHFTNLLHVYSKKVKHSLLNLKVFPRGLFMFTVMLWLWLAVPVVRDLWLQRYHPSHMTASLIDVPQPKNHHHDSLHTPMVLPRGSLASLVVSTVYRGVSWLQGSVPRGIVAVGSRWGSRVPMSRFLALIAAWVADSVTWLTPFVVWVAFDFTLVYWRMEYYWQQMALGLMFVPFTGLSRALAVSGHLVSAFGVEGGEVVVGLQGKVETLNHGGDHYNTSPSLSVDSNPSGNPHDMAEVISLAADDFSLLHSRNQGELTPSQSRQSAAHPPSPVDSPSEADSEDNKRYQNLPVKSGLRSALLLGVAVSMLWGFIVPSAVKFMAESLDLYALLPYRLAYSVALLSTAFHIRASTFELHPCPGIPALPLPSLGGVQVFLAVIVGTLPRFQAGLWGALLLGYVEIARCIAAPCRRQRELLMPLTTLIYAVSDSHERFRLMFGMVIPALCIAGAVRCCPKGAIPKGNGTCQPVLKFSQSLSMMASFLIIAIAVWRYPASGGVYTAFAPMRVAYNLMENPENYPYFCLVVLIIHKFAVYLVAVALCVVVASDHALEVVGGSGGGAATVPGGLTTDGRRRGAALQLGWDDEVQKEHERFLDSLFRWVGIRAATNAFVFIRNFVFTTSFDHHVFFMLQLITTSLVLAVARLLPRLMVYVRAVRRQ